MVKKAEAVDLAPALREAIKQYYDQVLAMQADRDVREARQSYQTAHHALQARKNELDAAERPYRMKMKEIEPHIVSNSLEVGHSYYFGGVEVRFRSGHTSVRYEYKGLDALVADLREKGEHDLAARITAHRKTSDIADSAKVVD